MQSSLGILVESQNTFVTTAVYGGGGKKEEKMCMELQHGKSSVESKRQLRERSSSLT